MKYFLLIRRLTLLLAVLVICSLTANAQIFCENGIYYQVTDYTWDDTGYVIYLVEVAESYDGSYRGEITIPETGTATVEGTYENYEVKFRVTSIGAEAFRDCGELTKVVLPNTITYIGRNAFYNCTALTNITLPTSLESIGSSAFAYCTSFTSIVIPNSVRTIDWNAFYCCTGLNAVTISNAVTQLNGTFFGCTGLTSVEIPESVVKLDGTFTGCTGLTAMTVPASVNYIGARTFDGCSALTTVVLPSSLTYIAEQAFFNCGNLRHVTCLATTPPSMYTYTSEDFDYETYMDGILYVPGASIQQYQSTDWWNLFQNVQGLMSLNETSVTLEKGRTFQLSTIFAPGFNPSSPISWRSSNTNVVTVTADGLIKAITEGDAFVYASVDDEEVSCEVIVIAGTHIVGDVDGDGEVGIADVTALIDIILLGGGDPSLHDVDGDGEIGIADVTALIDYILTGQLPN